MSIKSTVRLVLPITLCFTILSGCTQSIASSKSSYTSPTPSKEIVDSISYVNLYGNSNSVDSYYPVSYKVGGKQLITGDLRANRNIEEKIQELKSASKADTLNEIDTKDMYAADSKKRADYRRINGCSIMNSIATNGDWDFFPVKVRYEKYTLENQPNRKEWTDYFKTQLASISTDTPLIFTEAWFFDWNKDGHETAVVNAGNLLWSKEDTDVLYPVDGKTSPTPEPPSADNTVVYSMSALFTDENEPINLYDTNCNYLEIPKIPFGNKNNVPVSYFRPDDKSLMFQQCFFGIQYNEHKDFMTCPIFTTHTGDSFLKDRTVNFMVFLCDIDGDGNSELLTYLPTHEIAPSFKIYKLIDGKPKNVFSSITF